MPLGRQAVGGHVEELLQQTFGIRPSFAADPALAESDPQSPTMAALRTVMREAITGAVRLLRRVGAGRIMDEA